MGSRGVWMFRVGLLRGNNIETPDNYTPGGDGKDGAVLSLEPHFL